MSFYLTILVGLVSVFETLDILFFQTYRYHYVIGVFTTVLLSLVADNFLYLHQDPQSIYRWFVFVSLVRLQFVACSPRDILNKS